jgi:hypothetical protein
VTYCSGASTLTAGAGRVGVSQRLKAGARLVEPMQAQVIGAPLHAGRAEWNTQRVAEGRNVLEEDLFLQGFRAGGHQDALPAENRRHQIRQRLARAGPGFGKQHAARLEDARDGGRHFRLAGARLEVRYAASERAVRRKHLRDEIGQRGRRCR